VSVKAKFKVDSVLGVFHPSGISHTITLTPVISGSPENSNFFKYTPSGSITLSTINPTAAEIFKSGGEFYVDFTKA
jgi:hypothetical protein